MNFGRLFLRNSFIALVLAGCTLDASITSTGSRLSFSGDLNDGRLSTDLTAAPYLDWAGIINDESQVNHYEVSVGSSPGAQDILPWTSVGKVTNFNPTGLNLTSETQYYTSLRAVGTDGKPTAAIHGDGWVADPNPLKVTSPKTFLTEGNNAGLSLNLTLAVALESALTCTAQFSGAVDANDFIDFPSSFSIDANSMAKTITLIPADDTDVETLEEALAVSIDCGSSFTTSLASLSVRDNELRVTALFPINGANWNDYVKFKVNGIRDYLGADDVVCAGATVFDCFHGGDLRRVTVYQYDSCDNLTMDDSEGVFNWTCRDQGDYIEFWSKLKNKKGLQHLIDFTAKTWKPLMVNLKEGALTVNSTAGTTWWTNPIEEAPASAGTTLTTLADAGKIYLISTNSSVTGYQLSGKGAALVIKNGISLTSNGLLNDGIKSFIHLMASQTWIEGRLVSHSAIKKVVDATMFSANGQIRNFEITGNVAAGGHSLYLFSSAMLKDGVIQSSTATGTGIEVRSSQSLIEDVSIVGVAAYGIFGWLALSPSLFHRVKVANSTVGANVCAGTFLESFFTNNTNGSSLGGSTCAVVGILNVINIGSPIAIRDYVNIVGLTSAQSSSTAVEISSMGSASSPTLHNMVAVNSSIGFESTIDLPTQVSDLISYGNTTGIAIPSGTGLQFKNSLMLGLNTTNCSVTTAEPDPGLVNSTCANQGPSTASLTTGLDISTSFFGKLIDSINSSSAGGATATYSAGMDWLNFESWFRAWGKDYVGAFPQTSSRGVCSSGTCAIYDWRLNLAADGILEDYYGTPVSGSPCPASVHGDEVGSMAYDGSKYLLNAVELIDDSVGNDNGFCESNEACVMNRHLGGFQSEDILNFPTQSCEFASSTGTGVKDVKMYFR